MLLVRGPDGADDTIAMLRRGPLAADVDTTGLDWKVDLVGSINLAAWDTAVVFVGDGLSIGIRYLARQIKKQRELVFHHAKYDMHLMRETFGLHIPYPVHDTRISSHLLDNRGAGNWAHSSHHLKDLAAMYVDPDAKEPEKELMAAIKAAGGKSKGDWILANWKVYAKYHALDPWYTLQLHLQFMDRIRGWAQPEGYPSLMSLYKNEQWLLLALRDMEERGIQADRNRLERWAKRLKKDKDRLVLSLDEIAGRHLNWNSPNQVRELLYSTKKEGGLGLHTDRRTKRSKKTGDTQLSSDKNALVRLSHPIGAELIKYRLTQHSYSTGAMGILRQLDEHDVVHCDFNQNVDTGRMSCSNPNLQGQDRNSGVRRGFIPRKGLVLRMADAMAVEMRFTAHFTGEPSLVRGFNKDSKFDPHMATAKKMYGIPKPSEGQRKYSKDMNFASIYGAGEDQTTEMLMIRITAKEAYHACVELGYQPKYSESPHRALAKQLRLRYKDIFPTVSKTARAMEEVTLGRGFVMNAYGRHRYLDKDEAYKSFNSAVQGSAADYNKFGIVNVYKELQLGSGELAMLLQIHDEIVYESEGDPRTDKKVLELVNETTRFKVPITTDMSGSNKSWQDKTKIDLA